MGTVYFKLYAKVGVLANSSASVASKLADSKAPPYETIIKYSP
jgi:hypothetical protein